MANTQLTQTGAQVQDILDKADKLPASLGTAGQVLKVNSGATGLEYGNAGGGMTNPMTTKEDIIVAGVNGTPNRLAKGSNCQVLTINGNYGDVAWLADGSLLEMQNSYTLSFRNENSGGTSSIIVYGFGHDSNYIYYKRYWRDDFDMFIGSSVPDKVIKFWVTSANSNDVLTSGQLYDLTANVLMNGSGQFTSGHEYLLLSNVSIECFD